MNLQVVNFEVNPEHYQITRLVKAVGNHKLEYTPFHCFENKNTDCLILISRKIDDKLTNWISRNQIDNSKIIVFCEEESESFMCWKINQFFDGEIDFEKFCQWVMILIKNKEKNCLFQNLNLKIGRIHKDHDLQTCAQAIWRQNPFLNNEGSVHLFVKEKALLRLTSNQRPVNSLHQHAIKGISEYYEYLIIRKEKKKKSNE